jgi:hypothetical protein
MIVQNGRAFGLMDILQEIAKPLDDRALDCGRKLGEGARTQLGPSSAKMVAMLSIVTGDARVAQQIESR